MGNRLMNNSANWAEIRYDELIRNESDLFIKAVSAIHDC